MPIIEKEVEIMDEFGQWISCLACPNKLMQCNIAVACCKCPECKTKQFIIVVKNAQLTLKVGKDEGISKAYLAAKKRIEGLIAFAKD